MPKLPYIDSWRNFKSDKLLVLKLTGTACNISCDYCFERAKHLRFCDYMTPEVLETSLAKIDENIAIVLHGGEPLLLGIRRFTEILSTIRRHRDQIRTVFMMTNGTLLNTKWLKLIYVPKSNVIR